MVLRFCAAICGVFVLSSFCYSSLAKANVSHSVSRERQHTPEGACLLRTGAISRSTETPIGSIVGTASMYNPFQPGYNEGGVETASGELYDADAWAAAIQIKLREAFGGVQYGKCYRPAYALVEAAGKRAILRINDVGPLKPGRVIDFNKKTMQYFDPSLRDGLVRSVKITPLPGDYWMVGPIDG